MTLMSVAQAQARILDGAGPAGTDIVSIYDAAGRVLANDLAAKLTQPPFDASAMDGYAVRAADIEAVPVRLTVIGKSAAGHGFAGDVGPQQAVRIFTGAPLPAGADAVVIQENTEAETKGGVVVLKGEPRGRHIRPRGYDFEEGDVLLPAGTKLGSRHLMLAASMNHAMVPVRRKAVVAVMANGDELVPPGGVPRPGQIVSSIPAAMKAAIETWGGTPLILDIALDNKESLSAQVSEARGADVLVTIGGASVGDHDLVRGVLEEKGARFEVLKAAMRPGKPVMFGFLGTQRVLNLPGNPASAVICARIFLKPLLDRLLGLETVEPLAEKPIAHPLDANSEREHYMRAKLTPDGIDAIADQDSSLLNVFANATYLIVRPAWAPALPKGALVPVIPLDF